MKKLPAAKPKPPRTGGRPSAAAAEKIGEHILTTASELFLTQGYGATSIEAIAKRAGISKRTFYHRFADKSELFGAVVHRLVEQLRPAQDAHLFTGTTNEEILLQLANIILNAALRPEALALHRVILSEAVRFPELAAVMDSQGARLEAIRRIADLLQHSGKHLARADAEFAAEQFLQLVIAVPQRRAMGLGTPMTPAELSQWAKNAVALFLHGCYGDA